MVTWFNNISNYHDFSKITNKWTHTGRVKANSLASLSWNFDLQFLISSGIFSQSLIESLTQVLSSRVVIVSAIGLCEVIALVLIKSGSGFWVSILRGYLSTLKAFQISMILILAFSWLTDSIFRFVRSSFVGILSCRVFPFNSLASLFCTNCIDSKSPLVVSSVLVLTLP